MSNQEDPGSSSLDTALLESLFYNEMMQIEDSSSLLSSSLFSSLSTDLSTHQAELNQIDPSTIAEKALLRDFGVTAETIPAGSLSVPPEDPPKLQAAAIVAQGQRLCWSGTIASSNDTSYHNHYTNAVHPVQTLQLQHAQASQLLPVQHLPQAQQHPQPPQSSLTVPPPISNPTVVTVPVPVAAVQASIAQPVSSIATPRTVASSFAASTSHQQEPDKKKLVSQFATLASRLGIGLPPQMFQSLLDNSQGRSEAAVAAVAAATALTTNNMNSVSDPVNSVQVPFAPPIQSLSDGTLAPPPAVQEIESVAKAAIAAVTETARKRPMDNLDSDSNTAVATAGNLGNKAPAYSKRRKKPRLADCETKLAQLQAENEVLKRHLTTITNQSHKLDTERKDLEQKMRNILDSDATPQEIDQLVQTYSDYYSDYGRRRQQELAFHLEQLQRLANPTNFTKMGLWSLGQQSKNPKRDPIAGILQRELGITPQQGKKILEQRQKIRDICTNLSECLGLLSKLKGLCEQKTQIFNERIEKCREILTPRQVIKLMNWIDQHSQVLEKVCPGWGSEQIPAKPKAKPKKGG